MVPCITNRELKPVFESQVRRNLQATTFNLDRFNSLEAVSMIITAKLYKYQQRWVQRVCREWLQQRPSWYLLDNTDNTNDDVKQNDHISKTFLESLWPGDRSRTSNLK